MSLQRTAIFIATLFCLSLLVSDAPARERWTSKQANAWYERQPWLVGCNFNPSTAINQLEMWQADTFDAKTIDRELGWAAELGFNSIRVYLHNLPWQQDHKGFLRRIEQFLSIADRHGIGVMFVPLDGVWDPNPKSGKQREPRPHVHNSGWVQAPGAEILGDPKRHDELRPYITGLIRHFRKDRRVLATSAGLSNVSSNGQVPGTSLRTCCVSFATFTGTGFTSRLCHASPPGQMIWWRRSARSSTPDGAI